MRGVRRRSAGVARHAEVMGEDGRWLSVISVSANSRRRPEAHADQLQAAFDRGAQVAGTAATPGR